MSLEPRQSVDLLRLRALFRKSLAQDVVGAGLMVTHPRSPEVWVGISNIKDRLRDRLMMEGECKNSNAPFTLSS